MAGLRAQTGVAWRHSNLLEEHPMTLCPVALVAGCRKCPAFSVCPLKGVIGDYRKPEETKDKQRAAKPKR